MKRIDRSEDVCLQAALNDPHARKSMMLKPEHFVTERNARIWEGIMAVDHVDVFTVDAYLTKHYGGDWITELMDLVTNVVPANVEAHSAILRDNATCRDAARISADLMERLAEGDTNAIAQAVRELNGLSMDTERPSVSIGDAAAAAIKAMREKKNGGSGVKTGIGSVDRALGGIHPGDLVILGARPGTGKTSLMLQMAMYSGMHEVPVGIFSGEQAAPQLGERAIAALGVAAVSDMRRGVANVDALEAIVEDMRLLPIQVADVSCPSIGFIRKMARKWVNEHGCRAIFIDYLQRMTGDPRLAKHERVGNNARDLKTLAVELQIPVVVLAQVNRNVTNRSDPRPNMADLRDSGEIEQEADQIMLLYTDSSDEDSYNWESELILDKNRHGATGVFPLSWVRERMLFREREERDSQDGYR